AALAFAEQGLKEYELLAGLRSMGSTTPVDYEQLAGRTPNKYWEWALLTGALYNLAHAHKGIGDLTAGQVAMRNRVRVAERLAAVDPEKWTNELHQAHDQAAAFGI
ncbi:hypothetical protein ACIPPR_33700, partial [Streptomyces nigra]|uniref:hypothetical protein n=1 Tax=Streptomyces nigra TaxID=1827580 RepID=UPI0037FB5DD6